MRPGRLRLVDRQPPGEQAGEQACNARRGARSLGLWGEPGLAHLALIDASRRSRLLQPGLRRQALSLRSAACIRRRSASSARCAISSGCERRRRAGSTRPWLRSRRKPTPYPFLPAEGESLHQIPVGPVHAGIIEPGHFRFTANGETVVRLEERLGYAHKGIEALMAGAPLERAAWLAGRVSGDSTVAYAIAFAQAVEARSACRCRRARVWLRALDGRARAARQPPRRHRRRLQRRLVQHHARALRRAARAACCARPTPASAIA